MCNFICYFLLIFTFLTSSVYGLVDLLTVSGNPGAFTVNTATAGSQPAPVVQTTTYSVSTTTTRTISGAINTNMPTGATLGLNMAAVSGSTSAGNVKLTTVSQTLVSNVNVALLSSGNTMTYTFTATASAAKVTNATKTLTLTMQ